MEVEFEIDANGILSVSAKDLGTKKETSISITAPNKLNEAEVERMRKEAEKFADTDKRRKEDIEVINQADTALYATEKTLKEMGDKMDKSQLEGLQKDIDGLKELLKDREGNYESIKSAKDEIVKKFQKISEELYKKAAEEYQQQHPAQGQQGDDGEGNNPNDHGKKHQKKGKEKVVDAEFKEEGKK